MTITKFGAALSLAILATTPSLAVEAMKPKPADDASPVMAVDTAIFLKVASGSNEFEIQSSKLAKDKGVKGDVAMLADMIIEDHTKAGEKLKATLEAKNEKAPAPELAPKQKKMLEQLKAADYADFETLYLDIQAQAHMEAVALFRTYAGSGDDQTIVGFAKETLPRLETHMAHVKELIAAK
ncbi:DUF4142 domain-containing protein [Mangrovicella endophytica]|uniref:DUF4142 domain-containing protein n=1 Tax=Mangrovicella endophytica TaxID=2066697 RepID=UPI0012FFF391|nr:DUF4142 domain-containing protein [Mangrovicella endophytica]